jgi:hypothetical protein
MIHQSLMKNLIFSNVDAKSEQNVHGEGDPSWGINTKIEETPAIIIDQFGQRAGEQRHLSADAQSQHFPLFFGLFLHNIFYLLNSFAFQLE